MQLYLFKVNSHLVQIRLFMELFSLWWSELTVFSVASYLMRSFNVWWSSQMSSVSISFAACQWGWIQPVWWPLIAWGHRCILIARIWTCLDLNEQELFSKLLSISIRRQQAKANAYRLYIFSDIRYSSCLRYITHMQMMNTFNAFILFIWYR